MSSSLTFTEENFSNAIRHLGQSFSQCFETINLAVHDKQTPWRITTRYLHNWRVEISSESTQYLVHDTVAVVNFPSIINMGDDSDSIDAVDSYEDIILMEDESVPLPSSLDRRRVQKMIEYSFYVCYSHVWNVPVLYFRAQDIHGSMISRSCLVDETADWEENFISEEEHPMTGIPCFFLHPCNTSTRLKMMSLSIQEGQESIHDTRFNSLLLLSWLAMVLPPIQFRISPYVYSHLVDKIKSLPISD